MAMNKEKEEGNGGPTERQRELSDILSHKSRHE